MNNLRESRQTMDLWHSSALKQKRWPHCTTFRTADFLLNVTASYTARLISIWLVNSLISFPLFKCDKEKVVHEGFHMNRGGGGGLLTLDRCV